MSTLSTQAPGRGEAPRAPGGAGRRHLPGRRVLAVLAVLHVLAVAAGALFGVVFSRDLPPIGNLDLLRLPRMTVLADRNGEKLHSFAEQRRATVTLGEISPTLVKALLATEDPRFYRHVGVDMKAVARAVYATLTTFHFGQGGSTITQQLARDTFLYPSKTITRKAKEALLALRIEKAYTKSEILELYCNRIYLGHGRYGFDAASQFYFGKTVKNLTLPEAALLAGLPQRPEGYSPLRNPRAAEGRRNHVLSRMVEEGVLDPAAAEQAKRAPLGIVKDTGRRAKAQYFVEAVRRELLHRFGEDALLRSGLDVRTTIDPALQIAAERAVRTGLDAYGRRHVLLPEGRALPAGVAPEDYADPLWELDVRAGDVVPALVVSTGLNAAALRIGAERFVIGPDEIAWTRRKVLEGLLQRDKLYPVKVLEVAGGRPARIELAADPPVEASFVAIDTATGEVLALVGGKDYDRSEFDRALQAQRQAGSAFKPFIYAAAVEQGIGPGQPLWDVPTVLVEPGQPQPYQPENYDVRYEGLISLQQAIEHSRNIPTVRLLDALGYGPAIEMGQRLGVRGGLKPYPSLALGAFEVRLVDLVAGYAAFANGGTLVQPRLLREVRDSGGQELLVTAEENKEVLTPEVAAMMVQLLRGTTTRGTAAEAAKLGRPVFGKTGTTNDFSDAWFIGSTRSLAAGAWIGFDQRQSLGRGETGGKAALPIWMQFMEEGLAGRPVEEFPVPPEAQRIEIDLATGYLASPAAGCAKAIVEYIPAGAAPPRPCTVRDHLRAMLPYPLQPYALSPSGALEIPPGDAARLVAVAPDKFQLVGGHALQYTWGGANGLVALPWGPGELSQYTSALAMATAEGEATAPSLRGHTFGPQRGRDGWPAEVIPINRSGAARPIEVPVDR